MTVEEFIHTIEPWRDPAKCDITKHDAHCANHPDKSTLNFGRAYVCWQCKDKDRAS